MSRGLQHEKGQLQPATATIHSLPDVPVVAEPQATYTSKSSPGRPASSGLDWFKHDTDAATDEKVEALRSLYQNDGYAFYFILLERIYRTPDCELNISDAETIQILARKVDVSVDRFTQILTSALRHGCFDADAYHNRKVLTSHGIKERARTILDKRQKERERYRREREEISDAETQQKPGRNRTSRVEKSREEKKVGARARTAGNDTQQETPEKILEALTLPPNLSNPKGREAVLGWISSRTANRKAGKPSVGWVALFQGQIDKTLAALPETVAIYSLDQSSSNHWQGLQVKEPPMIGKHPATGGYDPTDLRSVIR